MGRWFLAVLPDVLPSNCTPEQLHYQSICPLCPPTDSMCMCRRSSPRMASLSRESGSSPIQLRAPFWPLMTLAGTPVSVRRRSPVRLLRTRRPAEVTLGRSVTHRHTYRQGRLQQPATDRTHLQVRNGNTLQMVCNPPHCLSM